MKIKFKSSSEDKDFYLIINKQLDYLLNEQKAQRMDLAELKRLAYRKYEYYSPPRQTTLETEETSPQTESEEQVN